MGTALALPWLEAMGPLSAWADATAAKRAPIAWLLSTFPTACTCPPGGRPAKARSFQLSATLEPLAAYKDEFWC